MVVLITDKAVFVTTTMDIMLIAQAEFTAMRSLTLPLVVKLKPDSSINQVVHLASMRPTYDLL